MRRFATRSTSSGPRRPESQRGASLIAALALTGILVVLVTASLNLAKSSATGSARENRSEILLQVADAGVNQYVSRLVEDPRYWDHFVDPAEDPRIDPSGGVHPPGSTWVPGTPWTYAGASTTFRQVQNARFGAAGYGLRITPSPVGSDIVTIQSTARTSHNGPRSQQRSLQAQIIPSSIADFQMISNRSIKYGSNATTTGKLYSSEDINHLGVAEAPAYAQRRVCSHNGFTCGQSTYTGSDIYRAGAYDSTTSPSFFDVFPTPIDFNQFTQNRLDLKDAAEADGIARNDPSASGWMVQFLANAKVKVWRIRSSSNLGHRINALDCPVTLDVPSNGAMYFEQSVVVSEGDGITDACGGSGQRDSVVNGRVSIATPGNVFVGGNIAYANEDSVLGLIAAQEIVITDYTPSVLSWRAATLAQGGQWRTNRGSNDGRHDSMTYIGAQATANGGYASQFLQREYQYDEVLQRIRPPFYPIIEGSWQTRYWREVTPPS